MLPRILFAASALGLLAAPVETLHYKIEVKSGQQMDMSALGQGMVDVNIGSTSWISVTSRDSGGVQLLHVVIDSSKVDAGTLPGGVDASMLKVADGTAIEMTVSGGKLLLANPEMMASSPGTGFVVSGLSQLYPPNIRSGVKLGDSWVDTVKTDTTTALGQGTSTQIRKWKASAKETDALVLDNEFTGTMTIGGGMANVDATSTGTTHIALPPKGPAHSASTQSKTSMTMSIPGAPSPIQMTVSGSVSVTPIK